MLRKGVTRVTGASGASLRANIARKGTSLSFNTLAQTAGSTCFRAAGTQSKSVLHAQTFQRRHLGTGKKTDFASMLKKVQGGDEVETGKVATTLKDLSGSEPAPSRKPAAASSSAGSVGHPKTEGSKPKPAPDTTPPGEDKDEGKEAAAAAAGEGPDDRTDEEKAADAAAEAAAGEPKASPLDKLKDWASSVDMANLMKSLPQRSRLMADTLVEEAKLAWDELRNPKKASSLERRVQQAGSYKKSSADGNSQQGSDDEDDEESESKEALKKKKKEEEKPKGPSSMVHVKDPTSQWDAMKARLADSPVIREIFKRSKGAYKQAAATDAGAAAAAAADRVKDKISDAREFWETSQNPLIYTLSGVWDNVTGETEEGMCTKELLKLDPAFNKEEWMEEVRTQLAPQTITAHMEGNLKFLKMHCGEACYAKLSNDVNTRKSDKITFESKMVDLEENMVIMKFLESGAPVVVCMYMVQQINVIRKDGEVVEGNPNQVIARFYSMAFQQEYDDEEEVVRWKITDYEYGGDMPYY